MASQSNQGRLTTHVLDTSQGRPASGLHIELFQIKGKARTLLVSTTTNSDGRTDTPLLQSDALKAGQYELLFHAGNYIKATSQRPEANLFLDEIPIRFGINNPNAHYHVPLLLSPFGYSTYRGS